MKKIITILMLALLLIGTAWAASSGNTYHEIQVVDEVGRNVTTITSVSIYAPDSITDAVIYSDRGQLNTITIPMTTSSTNTTLVDGKFTWYGPDGYNFSMTDGTNIANNANHRARTGSEGTLVFPSYITAISSTTYADTATATWGDSPAFVQSIAAGVMTFTPGADNGNFVIGTSGTSRNSDFNVYVGTLLGLDIDAGDPSFKWDGGAVLVNHDSNHNIGLNTGTSTGVTSIGNSAGGGVAVDTDVGITINADDSIDLTTSEAAADIDIDAAAGSVIIDGGQAAGDAVSIVSTNAAGGIDITSGTGDVVITSTDDIQLTNATAVGDMIQLLNTAGTSVTEDSGAIQITATAGGVIIQSDANLDDCIQIRADGGTTSEILIHNDRGSAADAVQIITDAGGITLTADGATAGDILIDAEDDIQLTATGKVTIANTEPVTISGTLTPVAVNIVDFVVTDQASVTLTAAMSGKILVIANLAQDTTIDLPAEVDGLNFEFWYVGAAVETHDHIIDAEANANFYIGGLQFFDSDDNTMTEVYGNGSTESKLTISNMEAGTRVKITCDGTNWYINGTVYSDTAPAFAVSV